MIGSPACRTESLARKLSKSYVVRERLSRTTGTRRPRPAALADLIGSVDGLPTWRTCETALSEAFHLLACRGSPSLAALLRRRAVVSALHLGEDADEILKLMQKYSDVPMSFADASLCE